MADQNIIRLDQNEKCTDVKNIDIPLQLEGKFKFEFLGTLVNKYWDSKDCVLKSPMTKWELLPYLFLKPFPLYSYGFGPCDWAHI